MIINEEEASKRLNSPMNLINQLRCASGNNNKRKSAMSLFGMNKKDKVEEVKITFNPFQDKRDEPTPLAPVESLAIPSSPALSDILENHESQIKLGLAHDKALELLNNSVNLLTTKLDDVRADKLPSVVAAASKVVESIRRERNEQAKSGKDREVHYHFYTPQQRDITDYKVIEVGVVDSM